MKLAAACALAVTGLTSTAAWADKPQELTPTALAAVQAHSYPVPVHTAFSSAIATLQSLGYIDINASKDAGTISATTEAKGKIIYNILWGFGKKKLTQKASILVEETGPATSTVRLNLHVTETKARGIFGTSFSDGKLVKVAEPYTAFFTALDTQVQQRVATAVPAPAPAIATAPAAAAAPAVTAESAVPGATGN
jgi:hypothetical protein